MKGVSHQKDHAAFLVWKHPIDCMLPFFKRKYHVDVEMLEFVFWRECFSVWKCLKSREKVQRKGGLDNNCLFFSCRRLHEKPCRQGVAIPFFYVGQNVDDQQEIFSLKFVSPQSNFTHKLTACMQNSFCIAEGGILKHGKNFFLSKCTSSTQKIRR